MFWVAVLSLVLCTKIKFRCSRRRQWSNVPSFLYIKPHLPQPSVVVVVVFGKQLAACNHSADDNVKRRASSVGERHSGGNPRKGLMNCIGFLSTLLSSWSSSSQLVSFINFFALFPLFFFVWRN